MKQHSETADCSLRKKLLRLLLQLLVHFRFLLETLSLIVVDRPTRSQNFKAKESTIRLPATKTQMRIVDSSRVTDFILQRTQPQIINKHTALD